MKITFEREGYPEGVQHTSIITLPDSATWWDFMNSVMPEILQDYTINNKKFLEFCEANVQDWIRE